MKPLAQLLPEDRENLTAYLDGELDDASARRIESILSSSAAARNEVDSLIRTYDSLNSLPQPSASSEFVEKTLATARLETVRKPFVEQPWFQRGQQGATGIGWFVALMAAAVCGFALTHQWLPEPDRQLLRELPIIENIDLYSEIGDAEFLRELQAQPELWNEMRGKDHE